MLECCYPCDLHFSDKMSELSLVDPTWEMIDPNPNIWSLFADFDKRFFNGTLTSSFVELMWSSNRMTSTAGLCCWNPRNNYATIKLSLPLLQLRSRADLVETLLHEMIHAYLFVTREDDNHESHGPKFHMHMFRINKLARTNITVYHTFHDEVRSYQQHVWKCDGPCALRPPYYGYVRRANNRKPGPYDYWWSQHQSNCGGNFVKISEPEKVVKPKQNGKGKQVAEVKNNKRILDFFKTTSPINSPNNKSPTTSSPLNNKIETKSTPLKSSPTIKHADIRHFISPVKSPEPETTFPGKGHRLGSASELDKPVKKMRLEDVEVGEVSSSQDRSLPTRLISQDTVKPILAMKSVNFLQNGKRTMQNSELPDLLSQIVNKSTSSTESSKENRAESSSGQKLNHSSHSAVTLSDDEDFTYDLPDFDIDDSIIIENVVNNPNEQDVAKSLAVDLNQPSTSKVQEPIHNPDEDEDDFTYDLPNFIPFCGPGHRLGSAVKKFH